MVSSVTYSQSRHDALAMGPDDILREDLTSGVREEGQIRLRLVIFLSAELGY